MVSDYFGLIVAGPVVVLGLFLWVAQRGKPKVDRETGALLFRHSVLLRGFALVAAFGIPLALTVLVLLSPPKKEGDVYAVAGLYGLFGVLSAPLLWEALRFALVVSPEGLECRSPWRGLRFLAWDEVAEVSFSAMNSWFVIRAEGGWKFRVSLLVPGLNAFLEQCEKHLPPEALVKAAPGYARLGRPLPGENLPDRPKEPWIARIDTRRTGF
jgi:hypothetical protein